MTKALLGAHLSYKREDQLLGTVTDALEIGATSGAFYIGNSRSYFKNDLNMIKVKQAQELASANGFDITNFIIHSPLVGNIASTDIEAGIFEKTLQSYIDDLKLMQRSGLKYYNFHPGSNPDREKGIKQIAIAINKMHKRTEGDNTVLLLETMMSKGNYIGRKFEDLSEIIELVEDKSRIGVCLDTCHIWDGGYDIKNNLEGVLNEFDNVIGLHYLKALHINDSKNDINTHKDRHEELGKGFIGTEALHRIVNHPKLINLPKALETPTGSEDFRKWKDEIELLTK